jgi:dienelactone hydrolase
MNNHPDLTNPTDRDAFRATALECLGGDWPTPPPLEASIVDGIERDGYRIEKVRYQVEPGEFVSAFVLVPRGAGGSKSPAVAVWHQHNGEFQIGKSEPAGLMGNPLHHVGVALAREGFTVICPDAICFEERRDVLRDGDFERFTFLRYVVDGKSLAWKNILDMRRAIDYLVSRSDIDPDRIGCYGHSLGSTFTWLLGPWEARLKCLVGNCCLPTYEAMHTRHILHSYSNFVPGLHQFGDNTDLAALTVPRPLHLNFGAGDLENPIDLIKPGLERIRGVYEAMGAGDNFSYFVDETAGHTLSPPMWERALAKLVKYLR